MHRCLYATEYIKYGCKIATLLTFYNPAVEVFPEGPFFYKLFHTFIYRRNDPYVNLMFISRYIHDRQGRRPAPSDSPHVFHSALRAAVLGRSLSGSQPIGDKHIDHPPAAFRSGQDVDR